MAFFVSKQTTGWLFGISLITLLSALIRFYHLDFESLWMDELRQVSYYTRSFRAIIGSAATQTQPPLDYFIGAVLNLLGLANSDWWVRLPSALFGIASVSLLMIIYRFQCTSTFDSLLAGFLLSICPLHVRMSQEARPYTIFLFLLMATILAFYFSWKHNHLKYWLLFSFIFYLFINSRWIGPIVFGASLLFTILAYNAKLALSKKHAHMKRAIYHRSLKTLIFTTIPLLIHLPIFRLIYLMSKSLVHDKSNLSFLIILKQCYEMFLNSFKSCFANPWLLPLFIIGMVLFFRLSLPLKATSESGSVFPEVKKIVSPIIITSLLVNMIAYCLIYNFSSNIPPKPQYLLIIAPMGAVAFVSFISFFRKLFRTPTKTARAIVSLAFLLIISVPMAKAMRNDLMSKQNRDWRQIADIVHQFEDSQDALFISITNAFHKWAPPVYAIPRYINNYGATLHIRNLNQKENQVKLQFGTIYAIIYKHFGGYSFPLPNLNNSSNSNITAYNMNGLVLLRSPGNMFSSPERLIELLNRLTDGVSPNSGLTELYIAKSRIYQQIGDENTAKTNYLKAISQCRNEKEESLFYEIYGDWNTFSHMSIIDTNE